MVVYIALFVLPVLCYIIYRARWLDKNFLIAFVCFVGFLIAAVRGTVGFDTLSYAIHYERAFDFGPWYLFARWEPVTPSLIALLVKLSNEPQVFFAVISLIQSVFLYKISKNINHPFLFLFLYLTCFYLNFHTNVLRAGLAILIVLAAFSEESIKKSIFFLVLGVLTHFSVVIVLPVWAVKNKIISISKLFYITAGLLISTSLLFESISSRMIYHIESSQGGSISLLSNISFSIPICLMIIGILFFKKASKIYIYTAALFAIVLVLRNYIDVFYRLHEVLMVLIIYLICDSVLNMRKINYQSMFKFSFIACVFSLNIYFYISLYNDTSREDIEYSYFPYDTFITSQD